MDQKIFDVIAAAVRDVLAEQGRPVPAEIPPDFPLYGGEGGLDSMALVTLIAETEARIQEQTGRTVVLADERAMSRRRSPFRTVGTLAEHAATLLSAQ